MMRQQTPNAPAAPRGAAGPARAVLAAVLAAVLCASCGGVRWESDAPPLPEPDATEVLRQAAAVDTEGLRAAAVLVLADLPADGDAAVAATAIAADAGRQLTALGGVWSAVPDGQADEAGDGPEDQPDGALDDHPGASPEQRLVSMTAATAVALRDAAVQADDDALARLLASLWSSRAAAAVDLAEAVGLTPADLPTSSALSQVWTAVAADAAAPSEPVLVLPEGYSADPQQAAALVREHDALGYLLERLAARASGDERSRYVTLASAHRANAEAWASAGRVGIAVADPRRVAYQLPTDLTEQSGQVLADAYLTLIEAQLATVAAAPAGDEGGARDFLVDRVAQLAGQVLAWGGRVDALPGLPELAG